MNIDMEKIITLFGTYGVLQIYAQDLGIESGETQKKMIDYLPLQILLIYSGTYVSTNDHKYSAIATILYYYLKYGHNK